MSYPDPIYLGEHGEASATFRAATAEPEVVYANDTRVHFLMRVTGRAGCSGSTAGTLAASEPALGRTSTGR